MNKKTFIFTTDAILIPLFILTLYTGLGLHAAGHGDNSVLCHSRAIYHTLCSLLFALFALFHIQLHWRWYKQLFTQHTINHRGRKAVIFTFSILFVAVTLSGIGLLGIEGLNSHLGLLHYKIAIVMGVLATLHICKRLRILIKGIKSL